MSKSLNAVLGCCSLLISERQSERKQGAAKLELLLRDVEVIHTLDEQTARKVKSREETLTWDYLHQQVTRFVLMEVDIIKADSSSTTYKKKHKELAQLYQSVVMKAEKRGPMLKSSSVFSHILNMLFKVDSSSCFIDIYTSILLKCMLVKRKHIRDLGVRRWHELLTFYFNLLMDPGVKNKGSQIPFARAIQSLLSNSAIMPYLRINEILQCFDEIFKNIRQEKNHVFLESILSGLTSFSWVAVPDARCQICRFGEQIMPLLIQVWKYQVTNIKIQLIEFFQLQLLAHFSTDAQLINEKTYPWMNEAWKKCLEELFQLIYSEFVQLRDKIQYVSNNSLLQRQDMIEFIAYVINQLQVYSNDQLNITISCTISSSKKSKITVSSAWESLIDGLKNISEVQLCITWLHLVDCLYTNEHLAIKKREHHVEVVTVLATLLSENNRDDITKSVLKSLCNVMKSLTSQSTLLLDLRNVINSIWNSTLKVIGTSEGNESTFHLLHLVWKTKLISGTFEVFNNFAPSVSHRSFESMRCLSSILHSSNFPNCHQQSTGEEEKYLEKHPLRKQLLDWLLPDEYASDDPIIYRKHIGNMERDETQVLCTLLVALICISPVNVLEMAPILGKQRKCGNSSFKEKLNSYLVSMHELKIDVVNVSKENHLKGDNDDSKPVKCKCLKEAELFLLKKLEKISNQILHSSMKMDAKDQDVCNVTVYFLELFVFLKLFEERLEMYTNSNTLLKALQKYCDKLILKFDTLFEEMLSFDLPVSMKRKSISSCLKCLNNMISCSNSINNMARSLPENLMDSILRISSGEISNEVNTTQYRSFDLNNSSSGAYVDFMDLDSDETDYESSNKDSDNPLHDDSLNEMEKVQLLAFDIATRLILLNLHSLEHHRRMLFKLFAQDETHDSLKLQMLVALNEITVKNGLQFLSSELFILVDCTRQFLSLHRFDMDVCAAMLSGIVCYIEQLRNLDSGDNSSRVRSLLIKVLEVFWSLRNDRYSSLVRIKLAETLEVLAQIKDDDDEWKLAIKNSHDSEDEKLTSSSELYIHLLCDHNAMVRSHVALHIHLLFISDDTGELRRNFKLICSVLGDLIKVDDFSDSENFKDIEFITKETTLLLTMKKLVCCSTVVERNALWLLFEYAKMQVVKEEHVFKVLKDISVIFGYSTLRDFMAPRIGHTMYIFLRNDYRLDTFPSKCLGVTINDFLRNYYKDIVPYYVIKNNFEGIQELSERLGFAEDIDHILLESFVQIAVMTLPIYSEYLNGNQMDDGKINTMLEGAKEFRSCITEKVHNKEVEERFGEVVLQLLLRLFDPFGNEELVTSVFTEPTDESPFFPTFSSSQISVTLTHLATGCGEKQTTIHSFVKFPERIPNIMSSLALHVATSKRCSEKITYMKSYYYFTMFVLDNLHHMKKCGGDYVVREIIYRVLYIIEENDANENNNRMISICFEILDNLCEKMLSHHYISRELSKYLCFVVSKLIHFTTKVSTEERALKLLRYLIADLTQIESLGSYISAVSLLNHFPMHTKFAKLNECLVAIKRNLQPSSLEEELKRIASNLQQLNYTLPNSVLDYMKRILKEKSEFIAVGEALTDIVACLERICCNGSDDSKLLAVDCLGLIGPLPISAVNGGVLMQSSELPHHLYAVFPLKFYVIIEGILQLCVHKSALISKTAWSCLLNLMKLNTSKEVLMSYKEMSFFTYIQPFLVAKKKSSNIEKPVTNPSFEKLRNSIVCDGKGLAINSSLSHDKWLTRLVSTLLIYAVTDSQIFILLEPLCRLHVDFARLSFPFVVHDIINANADNQIIMKQALDLWISSFLSATKETIKKNDMKKKMMEIINLINMMRNIDSSSKTCWNNNFWLDVNYLKLSQAAFQCGQYYNAALFVEIWCDPLRKTQDNKKDGKEEDEETKVFISNLSSLYSNLCADGESDNLTLLYNIYSNIGDVDAIYGVNTNTSMQTQKRLQLYQCENEFHKALLTSDLMLSSKTCSSGVLENLMKSELYHTALMYLHSLADEQVDEFSEIQFEAAWRNGLWDTTQLRYRLTDKMGFHGSIYQSLISLNAGEAELFEKHVTQSKLRIVDTMQMESNSTKSLHEVLSKCYTLSLLENAGKGVLRSDIGGIKYPSVLSNDFTYYEPSLSVAAEIYKIGCRNTVKCHQNVILEKSMKYIRNHCRLARESQRYEVAEKFISVLHGLNEIANVSPEWKLEEAKLYWDRRETNHAMNLLRLLMKAVKKSDGNEDFSYMYPVVLGLYGHWLGETRSQNPVHIMENYLEPAIHMMEEEEFSSFHSCIDAYHSLAKYADAQYESLRDYIKSPMFQKKKNVISRNKEDLHKYHTGGKVNADSLVKRHYMILEKHCNEDEAEMVQILTDHKTFLEKALHNYCNCLQYGDKYNLKVLRLCSLWFEHYSEETVNNQMKIDFPKIKSSKFLLVMYQLAARLGTQMALQCNTFKEILEKVIERCCLDHPHHSIFILLALCNADFEEKLSAKSKKRSETSKTTTSLESSDKNRINAAKAVLERVRSSKANFVQDAEKLAMAYIDLAYWDITHLKNKKGDFMMKDNLRIRKINHLSSVALPTVEIQVDPLCEYEDLVYIVQFDTSFTHCGGVNLPKVITCIGSDGRRRRQLIKGRDDLRQDAVMQQVFSVVNLLLKNDPESRKRDLRMRTYKVVPLSRNSGLMEWCEGTMPLGTYLTGGTSGCLGAHQRYYPNDLPIKECRVRLAAGTLHDGRHSKYNVYKDIEKNFHPVFRHFFYEKFRNPAIWFEKRLCYTRSTAVASIVGYFVGLGDRHTQNILIDCNSGEAVHIDLGVAFEKGKSLPTPETIPFRLTRDIVDGMGINGIEGVFRRCCEKTMNVIKLSQEAISTIVEVLLYDPLSDWTISAQKIQKIQRGRTDDESSDIGLRDDGITNSSSNLEGSDRNKTAERVLMRLKQKLAGSEGGAFLGIKGHVNYLIQEACNPENLCRLYPGWQPWL